METPKRNPFCKKDFNLTKQGLIFKEDPKLFEKLKADAVVIDAEEKRKEMTRTVCEFSELDKEQRIAFIRRGGEVVA
jgi:hypothetical protein